MTMTLLIDVAKYAARVEADEAGVRLCLLHLRADVPSGQPVTAAQVEGEALQLHFTGLLGLDALLDRLRLARRRLLARSCARCGAFLAAAAPLCAGCTAARSPRAAEDGSEVHFLADLLAESAAAGIVPTLRDPAATRAHALSSLQQEAEDVILAQLDQRAPDPAAGGGDAEDEPLSEARLQTIAEVHRRCSLGLDEDPDHDSRAHVHRGELLGEVRRLQAQVRQAEDRGTRLLFEQARELETERDAVQAQLAELQHALQALQAQTGPKGAT